MSGGFFTHVSCVLSGGSQSRAPRDGWQGAHAWPLHGLGFLSRGSLAGAWRGPGGAWRGLGAARWSVQPSADVRQRHGWDVLLVTLAKTQSHPRVGRGLGSPLGAWQPGCVLGAPPPCARAPTLETVPRTGGRRSPDWTANAQEDTAVHWSQRAGDQVAVVPHRGGTAVRTLGSPGTVWETSGGRGRHGTLQVAAASPGAITPTAQHPLGVLLTCPLRLALGRSDEAESVP